MFFKITVPKNFVNLEGKQLCWSLFLIKVWRPATLSKRDSNIGVFLWNLRKFLIKLFLQNTFSGCFCSFLIPLSLNIISGIYNRVFFRDSAQNVRLKMSDRILITLWELIITLTVLRRMSISHTETSTQICSENQWTGFSVWQASPSGMS